MSQRNSFIVSIFVIFWVVVSVLWQAPIWQRPIAVLAQGPQVETQGATTAPAIPTTQEGTVDSNQLDSDTLYLGADGKEWTYNNKTGVFQEVGTENVCQDYDKDGFYTGGCVAPFDCRDDDSSINPGATEVCSDNVDNNCDTQINEWCTGSDSCSGDSFLSCFLDETAEPGILNSTIDALVKSIGGFQKTDNPTANPNTGNSVSGTFSRIHIPNDNLETGVGINPVFNQNGNSYEYGALAVNTDAEIGALVTSSFGQDKENADVESATLVLQAKGSFGLYSQGKSAGILVNSYTYGEGADSIAITPKIGIFTNAQSVGTYAIGSGSADNPPQSPSGIGIKSVGEKLGVYAENPTIGALVWGLGVGIEADALAESPKYGDVIGAVYDQSAGNKTTFAWGILGHPEHGLYSPFTSYVDTLAVGIDGNGEKQNSGGTQFQGAVFAPNLSANNLFGSDANADFSQISRDFLLKSISSSLTVLKPLSFTNELRVESQVQTGGSLTLTNGEIQTDAMFQAGTDEPFRIDPITGATSSGIKNITFDEDVFVEVAADGEDSRYNVTQASTNVEGNVSSREGVGSFYRVSVNSNIGVPKASCYSEDFLTGCSASLTETGQYVGARPSDSTSCEAFAQKSNINVTVTAYCFDPQGINGSSPQIPNTP